VQIDFDANGASVWFVKVLWKNTRINGWWRIEYCVYQEEFDKIQAKLLEGIKTQEKVSLQLLELKMFSFGVNHPSGEFLSAEN
jgi:hypothetical protein